MNFLSILKGLCLREPLEIRNDLQRSFRESSEGPPLKSAVSPKSSPCRWYMASGGAPLESGLVGPLTRESSINRRGHLLSEDLSADMRVLGLAGLEAPSAVCVCNLRRPEMTVLKVRNILVPFAGWKGNGCLSELHHLRRNLTKLKTNLRQMSLKLKHVNTKFGVQLF